MAQHLCLLLTTSPLNEETEYFLLMITSLTTDHCSSGVRVNPITLTLKEMCIICTGREAHQAVSSAHGAPTEFNYNSVAAALPYDPMKQYKPNFLKRVAKTSPSAAVLRSPTTATQKQQSADADDVSEGVTKSLDSIDQASKHSLKT